MYSSKLAKNFDKKKTLTLMLLVASLANKKIPDIRVLIWEYWARAFQWISTWQGLDGFQKSLRPCALDQSSPSIERV